MGMFVNTLALRSYPEGQKSCREFLSEIREKTLDAFDNQDYQFEDLVNNVSLKRDASRNPLFDVMYVLQNLDFPAMEIPGLKLAPYKYESKTSKFDLTLVAVEVEENLQLTVEYSINLFKQDTIERFITYFKNIISVVVVNPDVKICEVEFLSEEEKRQLLKEFNDTEAEYPRDKVIHQLFAEQVERTPDNIALIGMHHAISYGELNQKSRQLSQLLRAKGVNADNAVGIMAERSLEMMMGIFAILNAGAAYLPLDPEYPP
jgi:non-ribosomal peptide synthetase component F